MEEGAREPKISLVEILLVGLAIFVLDFVSEIPILGPLLNFGATQGYLAMKGMAGTYQLAMLGGNALTEILSAFGLGFIPVDLVVFLGLAAVDHFAPSSVAEGLEKAGQVVSVGEGVAGGAAAGAAAGEGVAAAETAAGTARAAASEVEATAAAEGAATTETAAAGKAAGGAEQAGAEGAGGAGPEEGGAGQKIEPEALGEERELLGGEGRLQKELLEETPSAPEAETPEPESGSKKRLRESFEKVRDIKRKVEDISQYIPQGGGTGSEGNEEEFREAA